jgi:lambda family phage portal protein
VKQNWIDRGIAWLNPQAGLRRLQSRSALQIMAANGGYEGARRNRHNDNWNTKSGSADAEITGDIETLRDRARDVLRNNPFAEKGVDEIVSYAVSTGMTPLTKNEDWNALWSSWTEVCDADGRDDFSGLQALIARTMIESGECLVRLRTRRSEDGLPVPLQLQVLEPDHIDSRKNEKLNNGGIIVNGIEFDALGRRAAYWLFREHPGAQYIRLADSRISQRVDANDVLHIFKRVRPGQSRGVSWLANVLLKLKYLQDYDDAELLRKKLEACFGIFVRNSGELGNIAPSITESDGRRIEQVNPAMIHYLNPGEDITFANPSQNDGYDAYTVNQLRAVAVGLGVPYELLTGDLTKTNYSSYRGGMMPFRARCENIRWRLLMPQLLMPVARRFNQLADIVYPGKYNSVKIKWTAPRYEYVDPIKDITAESMAVRAGFMSLSEAISRNGYDPDQLLNEVAADNQKLDEKKLVFDTDARRTSQSGNMQNIQQDALAN